MNQENKGLKNFLAITSLLVSLIVSIYCGYLSILKNYWFIPLCVYFAFEALFILIASLIKDEYKAMRVQGVFQIVGVLLMMDYLLVMILWNDPGTMLFLYSYYVFGGAALLKAILVLIALIGVKKKYNACIHAFRNNDTITFFYLVTIIQLTIFKQFYPETVLFEQSTLFIYIIEIVTNAILTTLAAFLALSTDIYAKTREVLSPVGKIKHTIKWFADNEISVYFGTIFSIYLAVLAFLNKKPIFIFLGIFYLILAFIRFINYLWHKIIQKKSNGNIVRENRLSAWILLFDSFNFLVLGIFICVAAVALMIGKIESDTNIYLFLFFIIPFAVLRFVTAHVNLKRSRANGDTYRIGLGYISLLSAFFSSLEIFAISLHHLSIVPLKVTIIIILVAALLIAVHIICITLFVFWIKGMIQNRRSKEKLVRKN